MIIPIDNLLNPEELEIIVTNLQPAKFVDGKTTAGWHAKLVKNNTQLGTDAECSQALQELVKKALRRNALFKAAIQPKIIHSLRFSRYETGMTYGRHVDNALMGRNRSDVSFTLFLNDPSSYEGGELVIEATDNERSFKLPAGSTVLYPSSSLHRVEPVTKGIRLAAVGWVQSLVRNSSQREILFDLETARRSIFAKQGKTIEFDLLSKSYSNLLRMWVD